MGEDNCPHCGKMLDSATNMEDDTLPKPKDLSVCIGCGGLNYYSDDMALVAFPDILVDTLEPEVRAVVLDTQQMIRQLKEKDEGNP